MERRCHVRTRQVQCGNPNRPLTWAIPYPIAVKEERNAKRNLSHIPMANSPKVDYGYEREAGELDVYCTDVLSEASMQRLGFRNRLLV